MSTMKEKNYWTQREWLAIYIRVSDRKSISEKMMFHLILDRRVGVGQLKSFLGRKRSTRKGHEAKKTFFEKRPM